MARSPLEIGGNTVKAGSRAQVEIPVSRLITGAEMAIPVVALHGKSDGPSVWISAAIHGDEINGVEIVNQVLAQLDPKTMSGTVIAVPVVNLYGFITGDRYLPDRRDLNRSFPGSKKGSLAGRLAHLFMSEIVERCDFGMDLHTASDHRTNLPQIRSDLDAPRIRELAEVFGAPVMLHSKSKTTGTLRRAATRSGAGVLLYEAGEPWRFNGDAISMGVAGVRRVLDHLEIATYEGDPPGPVVECRSSTWIRAAKSGIAHLTVQAGDTVEAKQSLGTIDDAFGKRRSTIRASRNGIIIGQLLYPMVNQGDALVHIATPVGSETT